jgi:DtxR family Mn-dependent transcriptional regulator
MKKKKDLSASLEDYIEAILHIVNEKHVARSKEIASRLEVSRASVTEALRALARKGLINYAPYEAITMTTKGRKVAKDVIFRHNTLKQFFIEVLAIDRPTAEEAACRIEHAAPPEVIARMISFTQFMQCCPRGGEDLIKGFASFCAEGRTRISCEECLSGCLEQAKGHDDVKI